MTKEEYMAIAAQRYEELQVLNKLNNFYDYEKQFVGICMDPRKRSIAKEHWQSAG